MANLEHLELLRHGVEVWNAWRAEDCFVLPDLLGADLRGANLSGSGVDLRGANLRADFSGANLYKANSFEAYPWFLKVYPYDNPAQLLAEVGDRVIGPIEVEVAMVIAARGPRRQTGAARANLTHGVAKGAPYVLPALARGSGDLRKQPTRSLGSR